MESMKSEKFVFQLGVTLTILIKVVFFCLDYGVPRNIYIRVLILAVCFAALFTA